MWTMLNRHIPLDIIVRWWYVLVAGALLGFIVSLATGLKPFQPIQRSIVAEGPPANVAVVSTLITHPGWKDGLLFVALGFLVACGIIWLLEEIRVYRERIAKR